MAEEVNGVEFRRAGFRRELLAFLEAHGLAGVRVEIKISDRGVDGKEKPALLKIGISAAVK